MSIFDIVLLIIIGGFTLFGFWFGLVHTLGSLIGTVFGAYLASRYYEPMGVWLANLTGWSGNGPKVLMFIVAFIVINRLVGFLFWIIEKIFSIVTKLPFIKSLNKLFGLILGFFEGLITIGLIIYFIERFPLGEKIMGFVVDSKIAPYAVKAASILLPFLPEALKMLKSTVDFFENTFNKIPKF